MRKANTIQAFPNELRQLFANVISNAIDATPPGGRISITCKPALDWRDPKVCGVCVIVADSGSGIPDGIRRHIFQPFVTSKGDSGTGLGLWVCDDLVKRHGGKLRLKTKTANRTGTVFSIFLPAGVAPAPQSSELGSVSALDSLAS